MIDRKAEARWEGSLREGRGSLRLESGAFEGPYSFRTRFENEPGTNPEELIAAAHAGCFTMAVSAALTKAGHPPARIETTATVHLDKVGEGFSITGVDLATEGDVPGIEPAEFERVAQDMGKNCVVSRALSVPIQVQASLTEAGARH